MLEFLSLHTFGAFLVVVVEVLRLGDVGVILFVGMRIIPHQVYTHQIKDYIYSWRNEKVLVNGIMVGIIVQMMVCWSRLMGSVNEFSIKVMWRRWRRWSWLLVGWMFVIVSGGRWRLMTIGRDRWRLDIVGWVGALIISDDCGTIKMMDGWMGYGECVTLWDKSIYSIFLYYIYF